MTDDRRFPTAPPPLLDDDAYRAHRAGVTLEHLEQFDAGIARLEESIAYHLAELAEARAALEVLRAAQARAVAEYNRWAARPLR